MSGPSGSGEDAADHNVEVWKIKRLIKSLEMARGNGTSMISLIIPPRDQIARISKMLADEYGTASNIKSRVNRLSVLGAITSVQGRLKLYNKVPTNGLVIYCGTIVTDEGKEKKVNIDFEPFKPINTSLYLCDNKFHTEALQALLADDNKFGFIIMDGNGSLFGTLQGNTREVLHKFTVDLPKKHGRGGQSALRFARLRMEKRHNYVRKVAETAVEIFIRNDKVNVAGLILAGSADFKTELGQSDMFDQRLQAKIIKTVDISYGGENGFNQAIELAEDALANVKFIQEKKLINGYFDEISQDSGKYVYGVTDTLQALEMGAVETLICWENLDIVRYQLKNPVNSEEKLLYLDPDQEKNKAHFTESSVCYFTGVELELIDSMPLLEWLANNYKAYGAALEIVTDRSQEGAQFVRGFGGIGVCSLNIHVLLDWIVVILCLVHIFSLSYLAVEIVYFYHPKKIYHFLHSSESEITCDVIATATDSSCRLASCCGRRRGTQAREYCNSSSACKWGIVPSVEISYKRKKLFGGCALSPIWLSQGN
uniref:Eukaryotic peptide chain release factor subunit 1 n=1 Tax=Elaeophora elaphi TaxID=1147741 RepID=A0A158Q8I0_9BILA